MGADETRGYDELDDLQVDVVLDPVGGELFTRSLGLLRPLGAIVAIGFAGGSGRTRACSGSSAETSRSWASTSDG